MKDRPCLFYFVFKRCAEKNRYGFIAAYLSGWGRRLKKIGGEIIRAIKADLPRSLTSIEIDIFADLHIGDPSCDIKLIESRIAQVKSDPAVYCILNGDICNVATKHSPSDVYAEIMSPMKQIALFVEMFRPINDKILAVAPGNHEQRTYRDDGIDITRLACREMGIEDRYSETGALLFIRVGEKMKCTARNKDVKRQVAYCLYLTHGRGGGRKEGAKATRLADMASIVDADIYVHSHTHLPMVMREAYYRTDIRNSGFERVDKLFVNSGATLGYGGYGETLEFKPSSKRSPVIYLSGTKKEMTARL